VARRQEAVVFVLDTSRFGEDVRWRLLDAGMPFVTRIDDAMRVLDLLVRERDQAPATTGAPERPAGAGPLSAAVPAGFLTEPESKSMFRAYGIATTREQTVRTAREAAVAAETIGFPVVAKGVSRHVVHKSDRGLVRLALADADAVARAFDDIASALVAAGDPDAPNVVVQEMVRGEAELILGARYDETFGAQVLVGFGGIMVEVLHDIQVASAPLGPEQAHAMLRRLSIWPVLAGVRGAPAA